MYFLKSRYYDPETGRFTTRDRFKGFENRPASQNAHTYAENDPVNNVDHLGLFTINIKRDWLANAIDLAVWAIPFLATINTLVKARKVLQITKGLFVQGGTAFTKRLGIAIGVSALGQAFNLIGKALNYTSAGDLFAKTLDRWDGNYDGYINYKLW